MEEAKGKGQALTGRGQTRDEQGKWGQGGGGRRTRRRRRRRVRVDEWGEQVREEERTRVNGDRCRGEPRKESRRWGKGESGNQKQCSEETVSRKNLFLYTEKRCIHSCALLQLTLYGAQQVWPLWFKGVTKNMLSRLISAIMYPLATQRHTHTLTHRHTHTHTCVYLLWHSLWTCVINGTHPRMKEIHTAK